MTAFSIHSEAARWIPRSIEQLSEAHVATTRIQPLLLMEEVGRQGSTTGAGADDGAAVLTIVDSDFSYDAQERQRQQQPPKRPPQLRNVSLSVRRGELVMVCGPVGSGKSTLIEAVLGEAACVRGGGVALRLDSSRVAYCAQQPWIQAGTVRDNVLFAKAQEPVDHDLYDRALAVSALTHDLERLEQGDHTQIGELGVNLSGAYVVGLWRRHMCA